MKKIVSLFVFAFVFGIMFISNVFAESKVGIKAIDLVEKSENVVINSEPKYKDMETDFDMAFKKVGDYVKYKVIVKNDTNIDYKISEDTSFDKSSYMTYKYEVQDELKGNSETIVYVTITYAKEVEESLLTNDRYSETNKAVIQLLNEQGEVENPFTSSRGILYLIIVGAVLFISIIMFIKLKPSSKFVPFVLVVGLSLVPVIAYAIETLKLTIKVDIEIKKAYEVAYAIYGGYFTDEELESIDVSKATCDYTINVKKDSNSTKYTYCSGNIIYKDSKRYYADEKVDLKEIKVRQLSNDGFSLDPDELNEYCIVDSTGKEFNCDSEIPEYFSEMNDWVYDERISNYYGYPFSENDKEVMNFDEICYDDWEDYKKLKVEVPNTFTMPSHSVLFSRLVP